MPEKITQLTLLSPTASPQTGVGDGDSGIVLIGPRPDSFGGDPIDLIPITFYGDYSGGAATLTPYVCADPSESPRRWTEVKHIKDDGTEVSLARTADFYMMLQFPAGALVKWTVSGAGSPLPSIILTARGICRGSA